MSSTSWVGRAVAPVGLACVLAGLTGGAAWASPPPDPHPGPINAQDCTNGHGRIVVQGPPNRRVRTCQGGQRNGQQIH